MSIKDTAEAQCVFCTPIGDGKHGDPRSVAPMFGGYRKQNIIYLIQPNVLRVSLGGDWGIIHSQDFIIKYCPVCGRKL